MKNFETSFENKHGKWILCPNRINDVEEQVLGTDFEKKNLIVSKNVAEFISNTDTIKIQSILRDVKEAKRLILAGEGLDYVQYFVLDNDDSLNLNIRYEHSTEFSIKSLNKKKHSRTTSYSHPINPVTISNIFKHYKVLFYGNYTECDGSINTSNSDTLNGFLLTDSFDLTELPSDKSPNQVWDHYLHFIEDVYPYDQILKARKDGKLSQLGIFMDRYFDIIKGCQSSIYELLGN